VLCHSGSLTLNSRGQILRFQHSTQMKQRTQCTTHCGSWRLIVGAGLSWYACHNASLLTHKHIILFNWWLNSSKDYKFSANLCMHKSVNLCMHKSTTCMRKLTLSLSSISEQFFQLKSMNSEFPIHPSFLLLFFRLVTETPLTICSLSRTSVSDKCLTQFLMAISQLVWHHLT